MASSWKPELGQNILYTVVLNPTPISVAPPESTPIETVPVVNKSVPVSTNTSPKVETETTKETKKKSRSSSTNNSNNNNSSNNNNNSTSSSCNKTKPKDKSVNLPQSESKRPDFLPDGWVINERVRGTGRSAGSIDKYYIEPGTGKRFRSMSEVKRYLGICDTKKPKLNDDASILESSGSANAVKEKKEKISKSGKTTESKKVAEPVVEKKD